MLPLVAVSLLLCISGCLSMRSPASTGGYPIRMGAQNTGMQPWGQAQQNSWNQPQTNQWGQPQQNTWNQPRNQWGQPQNQFGQGQFGQPNQGQWGQWGQNQQSSMWGPQPNQNRVQQQQQQSPWGPNPWMSNQQQNSWGQPQQQWGQNRPQQNNQNDFFSKMLIMDQIGGNGLMDMYALNMGIPPMMDLNIPDYLLFNNVLGGGGFNPLSYLFGGNTNRGNMGMQQQQQQQNQGLFGLPNLNNPGGFFMANALGII